MANKKKSQKNEILWNIINSLLAGALVFLGACTGGLTLQGIVAALVVASVVAITQFKNYWAKEESEYSVKLFNFSKGL